MKKKLKLFFAITIFATINLFATTNAVEIYSYSLTESDSENEIWTVPPSVRVFKDDAIPTNTDSGIKVYSAKNEFEPFQIVIKPTASKNISVSIDSFGSDIDVEIYQVKYVNIAQVTDSMGRLGDYPDPLWPIENGDTISITADENCAFWFNLKIPKNTPAGDYSANVHLGGISVPVVLHVFNFAVPEEVHTKSQMNFSHNTILSKYSVAGTGDDYWMYVDMMKQFFIDHRLTSKSVNWSGGVTGGGTFAKPYIDYDCENTITDNDGIWGFEEPAARYVNGTGLLSGKFTAQFNDGVGFPSFAAAGFVHNDPSDDQRGNPFCSISRAASDWYTGDNPSSAYNVQWKKWITALQNYLDGLGYLDKAYHYFANEPQDQADYDAVAWYSQLSKSAAPNLKLMVSEEPREEIYNHPTFTGAKIDIWLPVLNNYNPTISHDREKNHNEETWIYFLHGTRPPFFNPITLDHPGIESKFTGWFLWNYRVRGIAYYSLNNWGSKNPWTDPMTDNHNGDLFMLYPPSENNSDISYGANNHRLVPSIRFELMRDGMEDYEYLYVLNGNKQPEVDVVNTSDTYAAKIISGLTSYTRDDDFIYNLRRLIGLYNGGEISEIPDIQPPARHWRSQGVPGDYYINFQDPAGEPTANPLIVNGNEYLKMGCDDYDKTAGQGWYSPPSANWKYQYLSSGPNELQKSIVYSDYGRQATFEFDIPNGTYDVTASVGWNNKTYSHHGLIIEGETFVDDEATTPSNPYLVRTKTLTVSDYKLTMNMGVDANDKYTMLNYIDIEAVPEPFLFINFYLLFIIYYRKKFTLLECQACIDG